MSKLSSTRREKEAEEKVKTTKLRIHKKGFERKLARKCRRMKNKELRTALWDIRNKLAVQEEEKGKLCHWKLFLTEQIISRELKRRELLEWALQTAENME